MALTAAQQAILATSGPSVNDLPGKFGGYGNAISQLNKGLASGGVSPLDYAERQGVASNPALSAQSALLGQGSPFAPGQQPFGALPSSTGYQPNWQGTMQSGPAQYVGEARYIPPAQAASVPPIGELGMAEPLALGRGPLALGAGEAAGAGSLGEQLLAGAATPGAATGAAAAGAAAAGEAGGLAGAAGGIEGAAAIAGAEAPIAAKAGFLANKLAFLDAIPGANMANAKLGLGAGAVIGGQILGGLADAQNFGGENSNWDQGITGAIKGLGLGGGAALALGMSGPAGWAVAGTAALLGGFLNAQKDGGTTEERMQKTIAQNTQTIQTLGKQYGINSDDLNNLLLQHQATTQLLLNNKDSKGLEAYVSGLATTLPQQMFALKQQQDQQAALNKRQLAMQSTFAPIFGAISGRAAQDNQVAYQSSVQAADQLASTNPQLASLIKANAAQSNQASDSVMAAYAAQMATVPNQASAAGYYQGQGLLQQYTLPGTQQIQQSGTLTNSQRNQLAQYQILQAAQQGQTG